ncbi:MAG: DMT family transporter [Hyphomicrobiales bacterium]
MQDRQLSRAEAVHKKGLLITFIGGLLLTFDTPLIRLADSDQWTVMFWRSGFTVYAILLFWSFRAGTGRYVAPLVNGWNGVVTGLCYALANICFVIALSHTSVANVVFMLALNPLFAALFSFIWLRERLAWETAAALFVSFAGAMIIVWEGLSIGSTMGDLLALAASVVSGFSLTVIRRSRLDLSMTPGLGTLFPLVFSCFFITSTTFQLGADQFVWLLLDGLIIVPIAAGLLLLGPRYITAAEVGMFFLLETVLAPIWVWLVVSEEPSKGSIIGGAVILVTLALHSFMRLQRSRQGA